MTPESQLKRKNICVYCGSSYVNEKFVAIAAELGTAIAKRNAILVHGGGKAGLMGKIVIAAHKAGGQSLGIVAPHSDAIKYDFEEERIQASGYNEKKDIMINESDAFITAPGGIGTLDELFDVWNKAKVNMHNKPIGILNIYKFYDHLIKWIDKAIEDGFIPESGKDCFIIADNVEDLLNSLYKRMETES